jgi:enoyl-CoA hydratase/carnithine racemase
MAALHDRIEIAIEAGIADIRLARPEKMNALDGPMFEALIEAGDHVAKEPGVRAVVLSGKGAAFCAGLDLGRFAALMKSDAQSRIAARSHGDCNIFQRAVLVWRDLPMPVIAAVHGTAFGGGFQLMLGTDIRIVEPETKLSVMEVRWGLVPDMGGTWLMPRLARDDIIRELTFTGRIFSGKEAAGYGLATRLAADPHGEALALAREVAAKSPDAIRAAKQLLTAADTTSRAVQLQAESALQNGLIAGQNHTEAVAAGLAKREPRFTD